MLERCQTQSQSPQMLYAGGECEGRSVDCGRYRVSQEEKPQGEQPVDQVSGEMYDQTPLSLDTEHKVESEPSPREVSIRVSINIPHII